jgi:putative nucleotidyltransferase with HDIG domain
MNEASKNSGDPRKGAVSLGGHGPEGDAREGNGQEGDGREGTPPAGSAEPAPVTTIDAMTTKFSLPGILLLVLREASREDSSLDSLVATIEKDPDLAVRVTRMGNSVFYSGRLHRVDRNVPPSTNLRSAVAKIGSRAILSLVFAQKVCHLGKEAGKIGEGLLGHLLAVAEIARLLGTRRSRRLGEDAYLAGLIHDIGKLALLKILPDDYLALVERCRSHRYTAIEAERLLFKQSQPFLRDHVHTGALILRGCGFPEKMITDLESHHRNPQLLIESRAWSGGVPDDASTLVAVANQVAYHIGYPDGIAGRNAYETPLPRLLRPMDINEDEERELVHRVDARTRQMLAQAGVRQPPEPRDLEEAREGLRPDRAVREDPPVTLDRGYEASAEIVRLLRTRLSVGIVDFMAHTGLDEGILRDRLGRLEDSGLVSRADSDTYRPRRELNRYEDDDIVQILLLKDAA